MAVSVVVRLNDLAIKSVISSKYDKVTRNLKSIMRHGDETE